MSIEKKIFVAAMNADSEQVQKLVKDLSWKELEALQSAAELVKETADTELGERA